MIISKTATMIQTNSLIYINNKKLHRLQIPRKNGRHFCGVMWAKFKLFPRTSAGLKIMQSLMDLKKKFG